MGAASKRERLREMNMKNREERMAPLEASSNSIIDEVVGQLDKEQDAPVTNEVVPMEEEKVSEAPAKKKKTSEKKNTNENSAKNKLRVPVKEKRSIRKSICITPSLNDKINDLAESLNTFPNEIFNLILENFFEDEQ